MILMHVCSVCVCVCMYVCVVCACVYVVCVCVSMHVLESICVYMCVMCMQNQQSRRIAEGSFHSLQQLSHLGTIVTTVSSMMATLSIQSVAANVTVHNNTIH